MSFPCRDRTMPTARRWTLQTYLVVLVLACLVPGMIGAASMVARAFREAQALQEKEAIQTARALVQVVDSYIARAEVVARLLAMSGPGVGDRDLASFHRLAREVLAEEKFGASIALIDSSGQQVFNTLTDFGQTLAPTGNPELVRRVFATGRPAVSDLFIGGLRRRPIVSIMVPVKRMTGPPHVLAITLQPDMLADLLRQQGLPADRVAAVFDSQGIIAARTLDAERFVGQPAVEVFRARISQSPEGTVEMLSLEGIPMIFAYSVSPATRWGVAIGIPAESFDHPLRRAAFCLALGMAALFGAGLLLAWLMARAISRSVRALKVPAASLGTGRPVVIPPVPLKEAAEVATALEDAAGLLAERNMALLAREAELASRSAALQQSELRLQLLTEHSPVMIAVFDREMRYLAVSRRWLEDLGLGDRDIIGLCHYDVFPDLPDAWKEAHRSGLAGGVRLADADRFERADGTVQWLHWELWPWHDEAGVVGGIVIAAEDVTGIKRVAKELEESEGYLRQLIATLPGMVWTATPAGDLDFLSQQWLDYTGAALETQLGWGFLESVHPDDRERVVELRQQCLDSKASFHGEYRLRGRDGSYRWFKSRGTPWLDGQGMVTRWLGVVTDIDDLKRVQEALHQSQGRFRALFEQAAVGIARVALDGTWLEVNDALCAIVGYGREEMLQMGFPDMTYTPDLAADLTLYEKLMSGQIPSYTIEKRYICKDGSLVWVNLTGSLVRDAGGEPDYFIAVMEDIQGRKETEAALENAHQIHLEQLEKLVAERTAALQEAHDFLEQRVAERTAQVRRLAAEVTFVEERERQALARDLHDGLLQLLHVVKIKLGLLEKEVLPPRGKILVEDLDSIIGDACREARSLTSQLSPPILSTLGLPAALGWLCGEIQESYGLEVSCHGEISDPGISLSQSAILFRAARELLINAAKHSGSRTASLELSKEDDILVMAVQDAGMGIKVPEDALAGTKGFGLASVRERMHFLGGTMSMHTPPGGGVRIVLRMPVNRATRTEEATQ